MDEKEVKLTSIEIPLKLSTKCGRQSEQKLFAFAMFPQNPKLLNTASDHQTFYCTMSKRRGTITATMAVAIHNGHERYGQDESVFDHTFLADAVPMVGMAGTFETPGVILALDAMTQHNIIRTEPYWLITSFCCVHPAGIIHEDVKEHEDVLGIMANLYRAVEWEIITCAEYLWDKLREEPSLAPELLLKRQAAGKLLYQGHCDYAAALVRFGSCLYEQKGWRRGNAELQKSREEYPLLKDKYRATTSLPKRVLLESFKPSRLPKMTKPPEMVVKDKPLFVWNFVTQSLSAGR